MLRTPWTVGARQYPTDGDFSWTAVKDVVLHMGGTFSIRERRAVQDRRGPRLLTLTGPAGAADDAYDVVWEMTHAALPDAPLPTPGVVRRYEILSNCHRRWTRLKDDAVS